MKRSTLPRLVAMLIPLSLLGTLTLIAQDAPKSDTPRETEGLKQIELSADVELNQSRQALSDWINKSANHYADFHSTQMIVSPNGLGIDIAVPEAALRAQLNLAEREGVTVTQVPEDSIGAKAGLKPHDVIIHVNEQAIGNADELTKVLDAAAGHPVKLKLRRAGKAMEIEATPKKPEFVQLKLSNLLLNDFHNQALARSENYRIGVQLSEADETLRQQLRLATGEGLVVTQVIEDTAAAKAGIQASDVLTMLDGKRLTTVEAINAQIQEIKDKTVELRLLRGAKEMTLQIAPRKTQDAALSDQPLVLWDTQSCRSCHGDAAHNALAGKLGADRSAWTNGHHGKLFLYEQAYRKLLEQKEPAAAGLAGQQIDALKKQLVEMQATVAALEAAIAQPPKPEEKKD